MTTNNAKRFFKLFLPALLILCGSLDLFSQTKTKEVEYEEYEYEPTNIQRPMFGIGIFGATNTVVETYKLPEGDKEVSYEGLFTPGFTLTYAPINFLIISASYEYSKNTKISEQQEGRVGATTHNILELNTHWIANPGKVINFFGTVGMNVMINTVDIGGVNERSETDFGLTAGIGIIGNIKLWKVGLLNIYGGWDILFPFGTSKGYLWDSKTKIPTEYNVSKYFSMPKFGIIFYPNLFN